MSYAGKIEDLIAERDRLRDALVSAEGEWVGHKELAGLRADAERYRKLVATGNYCPASIGIGWGLGGRATKAQLDAKADELPAVGAA